MNKKLIFKDGANESSMHPTATKGITLIALIITIIVLLILSGITIATLTGNNGVVNNAGKAKKQSLQAQDKEKINLAIVAWEIENNVSETDIVEYLSSNKDIEKVVYFDETEIICTMSESKKTYLVNTKNGNIENYDGTPIILDNDIIVVGIDDINQVKAKYNHDLGTIEWINSNEDVIKITTEKNVAKIEVVGSGNAVITAKVGEYTENCEIMVPGIKSNGKISNISAGTKKQLLKINEFNESGLLGTEYDTSATIDITDNIDMENVKWRPLSAQNLLINGNGNKISNLNCVQETQNGRSGFMGYGGGSTISNLTLENVTAIGTQAGAFVGFGLDGATLVDCKLIGDNVISWQQNAGDYKEDYSGIGALVGLPFAYSSRPISATIEGNVTINYNNMATYCFQVDEAGALGFKVSESQSLDFHNVDITNATITKEGTWTKK